MLKDEIKTDEQDGEVFTESHIPCPFCKQHVLLSFPETWDVQKRTELAIETCTCPEAVMYSSRKAKIEKLNECLENFFGEDSGRNVETDTIDTIHSLAMQVIDDKVGSASLSLLPDSPDKPTEKVSIAVKKHQLVISVEKKVGESTLI